MDLTNNETFQTFFLLCTFLAIITFSFILYVMKRKGEDIYLVKTQLKAALTAFPIILIPIIFHPLMSIEFKIMISIIGVSFGIANYFAVHYGGKSFRKHFGIETEEDRREKERTYKTEKMN